MATATQAAAAALGLAPDLLARAAAGEAKAQLNLGYWIPHTTQAAPTRAHAELGAHWLGRAAKQGEPTAPAVLGEALLRGRRAPPIDVEAGLRWLEKAVAANEVNGLNALAPYLYDKSTRDGRKRGYRNKLGDPESLSRQQRCLDLLTRAAALGSKRELPKLAVRLYDEIGTPPDDVAAKVVMAVARHKVPELVQEEAEAVAMFKPTRDQVVEVNRLARELSADLGRLPAILAARRAARLPAAPPDAPPPANVDRAPQPSPRPAQPRAPRAAEPRRRLHLGHLGLAIGADGAILLLAAAPSLDAAGFRVLMLVLGLAGAHGTWRCSGELGWGPVCACCSAGWHCCRQPGLPSAWWS